MRCVFANVTFTGWRATARSHENHSRGGVLSCRVRWPMRGGMRVPYHARAPQQREQRSRFGFGHCRRGRMPSCGANKHPFSCPFSSKWTSDASETSASHACWGPREPTSPKDRAKTEPKGPRQAHGVPEVERCQTAPSTENCLSRNAIKRHKTPRFGDFLAPFPSQGGPLERLCPKSGLKFCVK